MQAVAFVSELITVGLQGWIMLLMRRKNLIGRFPIFFAYMIGSACVTTLRWAVLIAVGGTDSLRYFYSYWLTELLDRALVLCALGESGWHIFRPFRRFKWIWRGLVASVAFALLYGSVAGWTNPPVGVSRMLSLITRIDLTVSYVVVVVGIFIFVVIWRFRIWQLPKEAGIILGFAMSSAVEVVTVGIRSVFGNRAMFGTDLFNVTAWASACGYILAEITWLRELSREEPPMGDLETIKDAMSKVSVVLDRYMELLRKLRTGG
jgi:hypothetical protein